MVAPAALLVAFFVVRIALVQSDPSRLAAVWPGHPAAVMESGLAEIGAEAAAGKSVDPALVHRLLIASAKVPLSPEPFLVRGVEAQMDGDQRLALNAFLAARERSPRSVAARYFLADHYLKSGQVVAGLSEVSVLARLVPQSLPSLAPFLAAFARSPGAAPQVKALLRTHPQLEAGLLEALAADASNADLIIALWSGRGSDEERPWQGRLVDQLVQSGRYDLARDTWARFAGSAGNPGQLVDSGFGNRAPPPFGWTFASRPAGVAEPEGGGRLHILFYGRDDLVMAGQLLTLEPGRYRLSMKAEGVLSSPSPLEWAVKCMPSAQQIASIPIDRAGPVTGTFKVPSSGCGAQRLELGGKATEFGQQVDVTISQLGLGLGAGR